MICKIDNDTEALLTTARKHLCQFAVLKYQQMDGLNTAMPFGTRKIDAFRTLTTESLAVFIPLIIFIRFSIRFWKWRSMMTTSGITRQTMCLKS